MDTRYHNTCEHLFTVTVVNIDAPNNEQNRVNFFLKTLHLD